MKTSVRSFLATAVLMAGASGLMASPGSNEWLDHLYQAKYGRSFPTEQANVAYREEITPRANIANTWFEDFWRAKYGRSSPIEQARLNAEQATTAYREETAPKAAIPNTFLNDFWKTKYGRSFPNK